MYFAEPRRNPLILFLVRFASFFFTLPYRIFYANLIHFGRNFITDWRLRITGPGKVTFGDNVFAWARKEPNIIRTFEPGSVVTIGDNVKLNGAEVQAATSITIEKNCILGSVNVMDTDSHSIAIDRATNPNANVIKKPIHISENVWVAGRSSVLRGVTIGKNSVIGYGSVVREDVPENVIVIGNPARVVKKVPGTESSPDS